jgi:16S rRNA (cytidine1402-2'-O)-methyltransferase
MSELYVVATPIGNLQDISQRAIEVLRDVDLIAAEDTRHSKRLLSHLGITTRLTSYHEHNEDTKTGQLIEQLKQGLKVALISDAGTPLISDPGFHLVRCAHQESIRVTPVPGASALVAALSASGVASDRFVFEGFLPAKQGARLARLEQLVDESRTLIFYESSHRIVASVADFGQAFGGDRVLCIAREITKKFETIHSAPIAEALEWLQSDSDQQRGEFVLILAGNTAAQREEVVTSVEQVLEALLEELPLKQAVQLATQITGHKKNELYQQALEMQSR